MAYILIGCSQRASLAQNVKQQTEQSSSVAAVTPSTYHFNHITLYHQLYQSVHICIVISCSSSIIHRCNEQTIIMIFIQQDTHTIINHFVLKEREREFLGELYLLLPIEITLD